MRFRGCLRPWRSLAEAHLQHQQRGSVPAGRNGVRHPWLDLGLLGSVGFLPLLRMPAESNLSFAGAGTEQHAAKWPKPAHRFARCRVVQEDRAREDGNGDVNFGSPGLGANHTRSSVPAPQARKETKARKKKQLPLCR